MTDIDKIKARMAKIEGSAKEQQDVMRQILKLMNRIIDRLELDERTESPANKDSEVA